MLYHSKIIFDIIKAKAVESRFRMSGINIVPIVTKFGKTLSADHSNAIGSIVKPHGTYTVNNTETLEILLSVHFPKSNIILNMKHNEIMILIT